MPIELEGHDDDLITTVDDIAREGPGFELLRRFMVLAGVDVSDVGKGADALDATVVILQLPKDEVAPLVPLGLRLAPNPLTPPDKHPLVLVVSRREPAAGAPAYDEVVVGIPYTMICAYDAPRREPYLYMPRMLVSDSKARKLAVRLYGYDCAAGQVDRSHEGRLRVTDGDGSPLIEIATKDDGPEATAEDFASFVKVRQLLEMPTISLARRIRDRDAATSDKLSVFLASARVLDFDGAQVRIQPVDARVAITASLTPAGLSGGHHGASLRATTLGSFRIRTTLRTSMPGAPATLRYPVPPPRRRQKVLVLGAGPSACAAAYWLALQKDRYEVHVYTQGFRLGGKCAAGRNHEADQRIEEHGLHAFLGHYENAIRTLRRVYDTAGMNIEADGQPLGAAFIGSDQNGLMVPRESGWTYFTTPLELNDKIPGRVPEETLGDDGDPRLCGSPLMWGMGELMIEAFRYVARQAHLIESRNEKARRTLVGRLHAPEHEGVVRRLLAHMRGTVPEAPGEDRSEPFMPSQMMRFIARYLDDRTKVKVGRWLLEGADGPLRPVLEFCRTMLRVLDKDIAKNPDSEEVWYRWMNLSTVLVSIVGIIEDRCTHLSQLDHEDGWLWLKRHGIDPRLLPADLRDEPVQTPLYNGSPAMAGVYETLFAHGATLAEPRDMAAGVAVRWMFLTAFGYCGYPAYRFKYSAAQTMLTPYYKALTNLGAKIHFFHRVTELQVEGAGDQRRLTGVKLQRQATVKAGSDAYDPFLPHPPASNPADQPPWPIVPNYDQLVEGAELREQRIDLESPYSPWPGVGEVTLRQGEDFDLCVLGIAIGALPPLTRALWDPASPSHDPRWTEMLRKVTVIQTVSMQLWFNRTDEQLFSRGVDFDQLAVDGRRGLLTGFINPEPSLGDETHLVHYEGWRPSDEPKFLAYHTGSLTAVDSFSFPSHDDHGYPERRQAWWRQEARRWLELHHAKLFDAGPQTWEGFLACLVRPSQADPDADRLDVQYFQAAPLPSDHYVLSQPQGMAARLGQMESGVADLYLCGDWTRTDLNCGSVEASTQSGMLCAHGISGHPVFVWRSGI